MTKRLKNIMMGVAALVALGLGGAAIAGAAQEPAGSGEQSTQAADEPSSDSAGDAREAEDDADEHVRGTQAERATAAALKTTGGGKANSVERDSENGATWEVEVTKPGGSTVDVRLDDSLKLVVEESDVGDGDE